MRHSCGESRTRSTWGIHGRRVSRTAEEDRQQWRITHHDGPVDYLIEKYYKSCNREMRYCHPGDLLHQVCTFCNVLECRWKYRTQAIDAAAKTTSHCCHGHSRNQICDLVLIGDAL